MKKLVSIFAFAFVSLTLWADVTIEHCVQLGVENYPLIKRYELLKASREIELSEIDKNWLPRISVYGQATVQNVVPSFPKSLSGLMAQVGTDIAGLDKFQYKIGADISQTVWDGGVSKQQRKIINLQNDVKNSALNVELYEIRQRIESLFFAILLIESQIKQSESALVVYNANLNLISSMKRNGTAMQSDVDLVEARMLSLEQSISDAKAAVKGYRNMLSIFTGMDMENADLKIPTYDLPSDLSPNRPETELFSKKIAFNMSQKELIKSSLIPKIGLFAQTYYGYPGINYFKSMMDRTPSFNILGGLKISWNIDSFYNKKNSVGKIDLRNKELEIEKENFIFNNRLQSSSQLDEIDGIRNIMKNDEKIISLLRNVRESAEAQLRNGIIDATALTIKINDETQASLRASLHQIQYIQAIYNLKYILNK